MREGVHERQKLSDMIFERSLTRAFEMTLGSGDLPGLDYLAIYHDSKHKSGHKTTTQRR